MYFPLELLSPPGLATSSLSPAIPKQLPTDPEFWLMAEERIQEILWVIKPTVVSDKSRKRVIDYVTWLLKSNCQIDAAAQPLDVFTFGSVPLKTYLPDGDIDLTILSDPTKEEKLAACICNVFEREEKNPFVKIKGVLYIPAKVKVLKCNINNIAVDISFNQVAGLSALSFLEQVDQLIGRNHLFKHSIILVKAWCYYESRILGANSGLFSTYALEALVLYVINLFGSSLHGPLAVLYKFLEYYSTFDWDMDAMSVCGPLPKFSLSVISVETIETGGNGSVLTPEFLQYCRNRYSVPDRDAKDRGSGFQIKYVNIVDPLNYNNNLGRSVSKGNSQRIKLALSLGLERLSEILMLPGHIMGGMLESFFAGSLCRNGKGERLDVKGHVPVFGTGKSEASQLRGDYITYYCNLVYSQWYLYYNWSDPITAFTHMFPGIAHHQLLNPAENNGGFSHSESVNPSEFHQMCVRALVFRCLSLDPYASNLRISRGTGTFIPDANHPSIRAMNAYLSRNITPGNLPLLRKRRHTGNRQRQQIQNTHDDFVNLEEDLKSSVDTNDPEQWVNSPTLGGGTDTDSGIDGDTEKPVAEVFQLKDVQDFPPL